MTLEQYLQNINQSFKSGIATEHTYRSDLKSLIESIAPGILATNEPKRIKCGAPDYVLTKDEIPVGFIEAKDIGDKDLEGTKKTGNKEQFDRYKSSLNNLIFTDYLDFHLYIDGEFKTSVKIGEIEGGNIIALPNNFDSFINLIKDFVVRIGQTITSSKKLAEMMAGKARMLSDVIERSLTSDEFNAEDSTLKDQMEAFKQILIHDITPKEFADVYAQTIAYGMFAARLHDVSLNTFTRQEAAELIPKSNPFLRKLFGYIAGPDIDDRIKWIVDSLANIFRATDIKALLKDFGKSTQTRDPIIHFYETFLSEYDPKLRKARGVWYTPEPVVNFIVRAVDDILKSEFSLPNGLADTSKTKIKVRTQTKDARHSEGVRSVEKEVHKVQILDPATGTGTFLAEVIKHIHQKFAGQQGIWSNYVENHLIPRINGFELLMASYAMAHLKIDLLLSETGYRNSSYQSLQVNNQPPRLSAAPPSQGGEQIVTKSSPPVLGGVSAGRGGQRLQIYLTNSLEEHHPDTGTLWASWLSAEANEANYIKRDTPVMCVIGNPPYSVSSNNKSKWIENLTADYKKDLNEKNIQPLSDDYIKFIRFGQYFIDKNGEGILAYISNNSFIDGLIHRQMRKNLLESFDKIYILDLHGNAKKKEVCPDGSPDQNVFDIMQGVSINIFVKTGKKKKDELGKVFHCDSFGKREVKYNFLNENSLKTIDWNELELKSPNFFFVRKDFDEAEKYNKGFSIDELFIENTTGIKTHDDGNLTSFNQFEENNHRYCYRPFDIRFINYDVKKVVRARFRVMKHVYNKANYVLIIPRQAVTDNWNHVQLSNTLVDNRVHYSNKGIPILCPLYLYPETNEQIEKGTTPSLFSDTPPFKGGELLNEGGELLNEGGELLNVNRVPNLNLEIVNQIAERLGMSFVNEKETTQSSPPVLGGVDALRGRGGNTSINNLPHLKTFRKELRNNLTPAEAKFWKIIQNSNFEGRKFRRQHSVGNYILDFYCPSERLAIELDGNVHFNDSAREYDYERRLFLEHFGIKVLRFENKRVFEDLEWMLDVIKSNFGWSKKTNNLDDSEVQPPRLSATPSLEGGKLLFPKSFAPIDILDYIYAVLHSPTYRKKYKEFLKIDFPRVPYPKDKETFRQLVNLGGELRQIHLLESPTVERYITQYPMDGDNIVGKIRFEEEPPRPADTPLYKGGELVEDINKNSPPILGGVAESRDGIFINTGKVWINETQYFDNVPKIAWDFYIGGYQPAQKWLKDRKERTLDFNDIFHYQKIIVALTETDRLMKEIDNIEID